MKRIDIFLLICIILILVIATIYLFLDIVFSSGIIYPSIDFRRELLIIGDVVVVFLGLMFFEILTNKKK